MSYSTKLLNIQGVPMEPSERTVDPFTLSVLKEQFVKKPKGYMTLMQKEWIDNQC